MTATEFGEDRDIFRLAPTLDTATIEAVSARLEFRGADDAYVQLSQAYFEHLPLASAQRILALGCGTGVEVRALKRRTGTTAEIVGVDHSPDLIEIAERLTQDEGLAGHIRYEVGDAHHLTFTDAIFDIAVLHTLISHVDDPLQVLREVRRVIRPGGTVAIFDGDYATVAWGYPDPAQAKRIEDSLLKVVVANPRIMRDLPRLLREAELHLVSASGAVYADIGYGDFWVNSVTSFGPVLARSGLLPEPEVADWMSYQAHAAEEGTFFGASNYYTYLAHRSD